jgi:SEC-C motif
MNENDVQLIDQLKSTTRCRPDIQRLADEWGAMAPSRYDNLATLLCERQESKALGILLNIAAVNEIRLDPQVLVPTLRTVDVIIDFCYPCRFQDEKIIGPLLEMALAEDISWERQALAAQLATELTVKFDQPRQPAKKVLWKLSKEIFTPDAGALVACGLSLLEDTDPHVGRHVWLSEKDILRNLPKERPPVIIGGDFTVRRPVAKLGRNEPCHCGSGKKYKKCCHDKDQDLLRDASRYEGLTRSQLNAAPSLVEDTTPIKTMRLLDLKKLAPSSLNDMQLVAAFDKAHFGGLLDFAYELLLELRQRPGKAEQAAGSMQDLFDAALSARNKPLADKLASQISEADLYVTEVTRLHHSLLGKTESYADLEALCKKALTEGEQSRDHLLLELSYAFDTHLPALSVVFGRAAIVSEPQRVHDNEILFDSIEKNRILLDLEPWGDPVEDYMDWLCEKTHDQALGADKDRIIEALKIQLAEAQGKSAQALKSLRKKELELDSLEAELKTASTKSRAQSTQPQSSAPLQRQEPQSVGDTEGRRQISALRKKIDTLKDEIRSQQDSRQQLRKQLQEARQMISGQEKRDITPDSASSADEETSLNGTLAHKVQIPVFSDSFCKSAEGLSQSVVAKALQAAAGFGAREEAVLRQAAPLELMPGYFRVRVGIHHRLILRQGLENRLLVEDIIPRKNLETWIRKHST